MVMTPSPPHWKSFLSQKAHIISSIFDFLEDNLMILIATHLIIGQKSRTSWRYYRCDLRKKSKINLWAKPLHCSLFSFIKKRKKWKSRKSARYYLRDLRKKSPHLPIREIRHKNRSGCPPLKNHNTMVIDKIYIFYFILKLPYYYGKKIQNILSCG